MTHTQITSLGLIRQIVRDTFRGDEKLFEQFHYINGDEEKAIEDTFLKIETVVNNYDAEFYKLSQGVETIGYVCVVPKVNTLYSFGLNVKHRSDENKRLLLEIAESFLDTDELIVCSLYNKNSRGIQYLLANGYENQEFVTLVKNKKSCL